MSTQSKDALTPLHLFYIYAREDRSYRDKLDRHLSGLKRARVITSQSDYQIVSGTNWEQENTQQIYDADIILLLVTSDFIASDYIYSKDRQIALKRHEEGEARVVPIIVRPVYWEDSPFSKIQSLPSNGMPIAKWPDQDEAFSDIVRGIRVAVEDIQRRRAPSSVIAKRVV